jgi:hypothetical protein
MPVMVALDSSGGLIGYYKVNDGKLIKAPYPMMREFKKRRDSKNGNSK